MIFWIASYPKSGNTWLRILLSSYYYTKDGFYDESVLKNIDQFPQKKFFNEFNYDPRVVTDTIKFWIKAQEKINQDKKLRFFKTHNACIKKDGNEFTNEKVSAGCIYVVRDPRDLCISWAYHSNYSIDQSIDFLCNPLSVLKWINKSEYSILPKNIFPLQFISSWSEHIKSWTQNDFGVPKLIIKYEDLIINCLLYTSPSPRDS